MPPTLADRLRITREMSGLSARALSGLAGLAPPHVSLIENGRPHVEAQTAAKLARVLGVSLDWLISGVGSGPTEQMVREAVDAARAAPPPPTPRTTSAER